MAVEPPENPLERIKGFVRQGETGQAIERLTSLLETVDADLLNEAFLHASRWNDIARRERKGVLGAADAAVERQKVSAAVLDLADAAAPRMDPSRRPFHAGAVTLPTPPAAALEKIIGANNLKSIAWLERGLDVARCVCRIVTPEGTGTGFRTADGTVWTNNHVFPDARMAAASDVEFNYQHDGRRRLLPVASYGVDGASFRTDVDLDVSVVRLREPGGNTPPSSSWGGAVLAAKAAPQAGDHVTIIQHPEGGPKQIALTANQVVNIFEYRLQYTTDTLPGSSGSPVFNDAWEVVALHHAGGNMVANAKGDNVFANEGILVSAIRARLGI